MYIFFLEMMHYILSKKEAHMAIKSEAKLTTFEAISMIVGNSIGTGIIAVPYLATKNSMIDVIWMVGAAYIINVILHLIIAELSPAAKTLRNVGYELEDCAGELRSAIEDFSYDPSELEEIEARLDELFRLSVKYGTTEDEMLSFLDSAREERNKIALSDERVKELDALVSSTKAEVRALAEKLTASREKAAREFERGVTEQLEFLDMPSVSFKVNREKTPFTINGADNIEFLISANAGETLKPLAKIASGGELSRIMLAIKSVIAGRDGLDTMIFDEIDAGLSGRAAQKVAMKLKEVSRGRQVICVTHSAQIAAQADCHMRISKSVSDGKTYTKVERLDTEGRKYEIARITGGLDVTELQLKSAEEMLRNAGNL